MRLTSEGVEMNDEELVAFDAFKDQLCTTVQEWLVSNPTDHDLTAIIFPHMRGCRECAKRVSHYFAGKGNRGTA